MGDPAVQFEKVSKRFRRDYAADSLRDSLLAPLRGLFGRNGNGDDPGEKAFWALRDVDFQVHPGEALGIIGPNGSGKSTTLKLLSRILRPDLGRIRVRGRVGALIELGAGFNPDLTGRENVFLNASILGMKREEIERKYDQIVEFAELADFMDMPVKWYSSGMFARLGFSVAVHTEPQVLLVDEVLSVGDIGFQRRCFERMMEFKARPDTAVIFVSHNMNAVATLCDRVVMLDRGRVAEIGGSGEMVDRYIALTSGRRCEGDAEVAVEEAVCRDEAGSPRAVFRSGESARIHLRMRFLVPLERVLVAFEIESEERRLVFGTNTMRLGSESLSVEQGDGLEIVLGLTLNLAPGTYTLRMSLLRYHVYERIATQDIATLTIMEDPRVVGVANLSPEMHEFLITGRGRLSASAPAALAEEVGPC